MHGRVSDDALTRRLREGRHPSHDVVFVHGLDMATDYLEPTMRLLARDFAVSGLDLPVRFVGHAEGRLCHTWCATISGRIVPGAAHAVPFSHPQPLAAEIVAIAARLDRNRMSV